MINVSDGNLIWRFFSLIDVVANKWTTFDLDFSFQFLFCIKLWLQHWICVVFVFGYTVLPLSVLPLWCLLCLYLCPPAFPVLIFNVNFGLFPVLLWRLVFFLPLNPLIHSHRCSAILCITFHDLLVSLASWCFWMSAKIYILDFVLSLN